MTESGSPGARLACVSVDLDEVHHYRAIHGVGAVARQERGPVYELALDRFQALAAELGIGLTFFVVGADVRQPANAAQLCDLAKAGHELGNHTLDHRYDLVRLGRAEQLRQVLEARQLIEAASGVEVVGFRAPGYRLSPGLVEVLAGAGLLYDSSLFPCPAYQVAKLIAVGGQCLRGRSSASIFDSPRAALAPLRPYRLGRPYTRPGGGLLELPIQVTPGLRLPYIGTALTLGGTRVARWLTGQLRRLDFVNLELHGIDLLDSADGLSELGHYQPDLRIPWRSKRSTLASAVRELQTMGFRCVRLAEAAPILRSRLAGQRN